MQVVNVRKKNLNENGFTDFEDWVKCKDHVYIGRNMNFYVKGAVGSKWRNPFKAKKYTLEESLNLYENHIRNSNLYDQLEELDGKILGCWCHPNKCHGDVLCKLLKQKKEYN